MKKIQFAFIATMMLACFTSCDEKKELFNGEDLTGWVGYVNPQDSVDASEVYSVKDGNIFVKGQPFGYLRTVDKYGDYKLHVEWRWVGEPTNSGIFQRVQDGDALWPEAIECQLCHGKAGDYVMLGGAKVLEIECVGEYPVKDRNGDYENAPGEWNTADIECKGNVITVHINGQLQNQCTGEHTEGYIALQSEGGPIEFRNVYITE